MSGAGGGVLVLASGSPRRRMLLEEKGYRFRVAVPEVEEREDSALTVRELTRWNALHKGMTVARRYRDEVVLAADTLVSLEGEILSKPRDYEEAAAFLRRLSGRTHQVCSSVFVAHLSRRQIEL